MTIFRRGGSVKNMTLDEAVRRGLLSGGNTGEVTTVSSVAEAYEIVSLVRRCVTKIADAVAGVPFKVTLDGDVLPPEQAWSFENNRHELIKNTVRLYLTYGFALWEPVYDTRFLRRFDLLNSYAIHPETHHTDTDGNPILRFRQTLRTRQREINPDDVVFFREFNVRDDLNPGKGMAYSAIRDAQMMAYATDFASKHFIVGPHGITILEFPKGTSQDNKNLAKNFFRRVFNKGLRSIGRVLPLEDGGMTINQIKGDMKDIAQDKLDAKSRRAIADAFHMPYSMVVEGAANFAVAQEDKKDFYEGIVSMVCHMMEATINSQVYRENKPDDTGIRLEFAIRELPLFQADEEKRSSVLNTLVVSGTPFDLAWETAGYDPAMLEAYREANQEDDPPAQEQDATVPEEENDFEERLRRLEGQAGQVEEADAKALPAKRQMKMEMPRPVVDECFASVPLGDNNTVIHWMRTIRDQIDLEGIEWSPPHEYHMTLVFSPQIPVNVMKAIASRVQFNHFDVSIEGVGIFDNPDEKALHLVIENNEWLAGLQQQIARMVRDAGYPLSPYSEPIAYQPHVTLGYLPEMIDLEVIDFAGTHHRLPVTSVQFTRSNYEPIAIAHGTEMKSQDMELRKELDAYENWYKKRAGKTIKRKFTAFHIPRTLKAAIEGSIDSDSTVDEIELVFHDARVRTGGCDDESCQVCHH